MARLVVLGFVVAPLVAAAAGALMASASAVAANAAPGSLEDYELVLDAEDAEDADDAEVAYRAPVAAEDATGVTLEGIVEFGYQDEQGRYVIDVLQRDKAYLGVRMADGEGRAVQGAMPDIALEGGSQLVLSEITTSAEGVLNFGVIGGEMGLDTVTVSFADASVQFAINVISLEAAGFPQLRAVEGGIPWDTLLQARIDWTEEGLKATFPEAIDQQSGETIKLSGFMMPLEPELEQNHFLLTSNPPSCFFHIPGGPAGSVEVFSAEGIEASWDPIVIEGRFEPQPTSEFGVVYRLHDAVLVRE